MKVNRYSPYFYCWVAIVSFLLATLMALLFGCARGGDPYAVDRQRAESIPGVWTINMTSDKTYVNGCLIFTLKSWDYHIHRAYYEVSTRKAKAGPGTLDTLAGVFTFWFQYDPGYDGLVTLTMTVVVDFNAMTFKGNYILEFRERILDAGIVTGVKGGQCESARDLQFDWEQFDLQSSEQ